MIKNLNKSIMKLIQTRMQGAASLLEITYNYRGTSDFNFILFSFLCPYNT